MLHQVRTRGCLAGDTPAASSHHEEDEQPFSSSQAPSRSWTGQRERTQSLVSCFPSSPDLPDVNTLCGG